MNMLCFLVSVRKLLSISLLLYSRSDLLLLSVLAILASQVLAVVGMLRGAMFKSPVFVGDCWLLIGMAADRSALKHSEAHEIDI